MRKQCKYGPKYKKEEDTCSYKRYLFQAKQKGDLPWDMYEEYADPESVRIAASPIRWGELSIFQFNT